MLIVKRCSKCDEVKPISEFYRKAYEKNKFRSKCKKCSKKYQKEIEFKAKNEFYKEEKW